MARARISGNFGIEEPLQTVSPKTRGAKRVWYKPNHRSFGAFIRSEQMRDVTAEVARDVALEATSSIPPPGPETDPNRVEANYEVKREAGLIKVSGNLRVRVLVEGTGEGAERAEFGYSGSKERHRTLARAGAKFGDFRFFREGTDTA